MRTKLPILATATCLLLGSAPGLAKSTKTVQVDCDKGDSIGKALETNADELILQIRGLCFENVTVERDNVTLEGTDPISDGLAGPSPGSSLNVLVFTSDASRLTFRNLTFANSNAHGLYVQNGQNIRVENCIFRDNPGTGAAFYDASYGTIYDSTFANNARYGLLLAAGANVTANDTVFEDNGRWAIYAVEDSTARLQAADGGRCWVEGGSGGLAAVQDGFIWVADCTIDVPGGIALSSFEQSDLNVYYTTFSGDLWAEWKSLIWMGETYQTAPGPDGNLFAHNSTLVMTWGDSALAGTTLFDSFSTGSIEDGVTGSFDVLLCEDGGDMTCGGPAPASNSGATGCGFCP